MNKFKLSLSVKLGFIIMFVALIGIGSLGYLSYQDSKKIFKENNTQLLIRRVEKYEDSIKESLKNLRYDITLLSFDRAVLGYLRAYNSPYKYDEKTNKTYSQFEKEIQTLFNLMIKQNEPYFQIRLIDATNGLELIKLVKDDGKIRVIKKEKLQNKFDTNYVQGVLQNNDDIFISEIDLNREYGIIEFPLKPTIRVAKLIKINSKNAGIVVINANVNKLFHFDKVIEEKSYTFVANDKGYYLLNPIAQYKEFGFEFGKNYKIYDDLAFIKQLYLNEKNEITAVHDNHLFVAKKIFFAPDRFIVIVKGFQNAFFGSKSKDYILKLISYILAISLVIAVITALIVKKIMNPIVKLREITNKIAETKGEKEIPINIDSKDEIGDLAKSFKTMLDALISSKREIEEFANKLETEVANKTRELQELNMNLQKKVEEKIREIREKDQALIQQSKMAAMGEMIGAIAHQWRQPLNTLAINIQLLIEMAENDECDVDTVYEFVERNMKTIQFMSKTIDDFRNFFKEDKEKVIFDIKQAIESVVELQQAQLKENNIEVKMDVESYKVYGYRNEFMQVILNIISNSKDAIKERQKVAKDFRGLIEIKNYIEEDRVVVTIKDNGGGIPPELINKIYEPYFTTKESGTGIGLYMSKEIMKNMDGDIDVVNEPDGAKFLLKVPLWKE